VPRVEDDPHAREAARDFRPRELGRLGLLPRALHVPGVVLRKELVGEDVERDLHRVADRDRVDVRDPRALGELEREVVHVRGIEAAREAHDDGRIERLSLSQPVHRVAALLVLSEDEVRRLALRDRLGVAEGRDEELGGNADRRARRHDAVRKRVLAGEVRGARRIAGKPLRERREALFLDRDVEPRRRRADVRREERLDRGAPALERERAP
jgi:hypothetical protein